MDDRQAIERYRYLLRTAPPDDIERAHAEAFTQLTPEQRRMVLRQLREQLPPGERASSDDPADLARMATRAELRQPGTLERTFGSMQAGPGLGGILLSTIAGAFVGTAIADAIFADAPAPGTDAPAVGNGDADAGAEYGDFGGDFGGGDIGI